MVSDPRHAMVFECSQNDFWLNMVPTTELPDGRLGDDGPLASKMYGPFGSVEEARGFAEDRFQNTGFEIPVYVDEWKKELLGNDDRVDLHYVIHRLEDIVSGTNQKDETVLRQVEELKRELIYNLGVNQLRRKDRG